VATLGTGGAPAQLIQNFDALFSTSLANYRASFEDQISESNAIFYEAKRNGMWEPQDGGLYIAEPLMYELGSFDAYDGYDELPDQPTDGITQSLWEWRQAATAISYSMKELKQNKHRLRDLVKAKIKQAELGSVEGFNKQFLRGSFASGGTSLVTPYTSSATGAVSIEPLAKLIHYTPSSSLVVGNINQNTQSWWRNRTATSTATTYLGLLLEFDNMYNTCARGPGGEPNLILTDQKTFELVNAAYYQQYRTSMTSDGNYPFVNLRFRNARLVFDQYMHDVESNTIATSTYGSAYFVNSKFLKVVVESSTNFVQTEFAKPPKGDSRLAHILFMGQTLTNNRRKLGVLGKIARTLT